MSIYKEFKEFAIRGSAIDLAVGIVIGAAFNQVVSSLVGDILNPILSMFTGHVDFGNIRLHVFGQNLRFGSFITTLINFVIVAFAVFLIVRQMNRFRSITPPSEQDCPYCDTKISINAIRCPNCTSELAPVN